MAEKKKILYIVEAMGGGVFTYIVDLANELVNTYDMYIAYAVRKQTPSNYKDYFNKSISWFENVFDKQVPQSKSKTELVKCERLTAKECLKKLLYQDGVETSAWGKIYKRELFKQLRYPVGKLYEDIPVTYQAIKMSNRIAVISNIDYYYFQRTDSIQYQHFTLKKLDGVFHCRQLMENVKRDYPELSSAAECRYFSTVCNILFQIHTTEFEQQKNELWSEVKKYRKNVLLDNAGRKKARLAAILSFGGYNLLSKVYKRTQGRG